VRRLSENVAYKRRLIGVEIHHVVQNRKDHLRKCILKTIKENHLKLIVLNLKKLKVNTGKKNIQKIINMESIITELLKYSDDILEIGNSISDNRINLFEKKYNVILPNDFKEFITKINGFSLLGNGVYGFDENIAESIEYVYHFEHFEVIYPLPLFLVPFCNDGRGNFYCLDTSKNNDTGRCPIVFWVSNYEYTNYDLPEIVNDDFMEWVKKEIIEWTFEEYNYDGSEKVQDSPTI